MATETDKKALRVAEKLCDELNGYISGSCKVQYVPESLLAPRVVFTDCVTTVLTPRQVAIIAKYINPDPTEPSPSIVAGRDEDGKPELHISIY